MARGSKNSDYFEKLENGKYQNKKTGAIGELKVGRGGGFYIAEDTGSTSKKEYEMARPNETKLFRMIDDGILDEEDVNKMALKYNGVDEIKDAMRVLDYDTSKYTDIDSIYNDGDLDDYDLSRIGQELLAEMPDDDIADMMRANDIVEYGDEEYTPEEEFDTQESRDNEIDNFLDKYPRWEDGDYDEDDYDELSANLGLSRDDTIDEIYSRIQRKAYEEDKDDSGIELYHSSKNNIDKYEDTHFGNNSLGGLSKGDAIYFTKSQESASKYNNDGTEQYIQKVLLKNSNIVPEEEYERLLKEEYDNGNKKAYDSKERRNIMLKNGVDGVEYADEVAIFNTDKLNESERQNVYEKKAEKNKKNYGTELQEELYKASQETIRRSKANQKALEEGKHPYVLELAKFINDRNDDLTDEEFGALYKALEILRKRNQKK